MSLHRFFLDDQVLSAEEGGSFALRLSDGDAHHARVLRLAPGEHIAVVDAAGDCFECEVARAGDDVVVSIASREGGVEPAFRLTLFQALVKGDKMETVIRHATEVGVAAFVPLACRRSVVKLDGKKAAAKTERWRAIAKSAAMQSGQARIPEVSEPMTVGEAASMLAEATAVLVCWEEAPGSASLREAIQGALAATRTPAADARIAVVVGPEGGLAEEEVRALLASNPRARLVTLGPSILRTETAGIVAPALALYELGAMGNGPERAEIERVEEDAGTVLSAPSPAAEGFAAMFPSAEIADA